MLARRPRRFIRFTRRDAVRLVIAATLLVAGMTAILSIEIVPAPFRAVRGGVADRDIVAPRSVSYVSYIGTQQQQEQARNNVGPQYDFTTQKGEQAAERQGEMFDTDMGPIDAAFAAAIRAPTRRQALAGASPNLSSSSLATLQGLSAVEWTNLRTEMARVLDSAQRAEVRDTSLDDSRAQLLSKFATRFAVDQRTLAAEIIAPFLVANSTYD